MAQEVLSRAVALVTGGPGEFSRVGEWLDKHYSEATLRALCERRYRHNFAHRLYLLRRDSHTYKRRLAIRHGCPLEDLKRERISEALMRGERLEGTKLVCKVHPVDTVVDKTNVGLVFAWEDQQYRRHFREIRAERRAATMDEHDHPEKLAWRLGRAVRAIMEAEYPDPPEHVEHSRRIVGMAALLVCADPLPMLGEFGRWAWESKPDMTWESDPANPQDDFWRVLSQPPVQDGPYKMRLDILHARHEGREEMLFHRMPGEPRELQPQWGDLSSFCNLLRVAVDELEQHTPTTWPDSSYAAKLTEAEPSHALPAQMSNQPLAPDKEPHEERSGDADVKVKTSHSADFTFVNWYGTEYTFALGVQSSAVKALWGEWEKTELGLHQDTIRDAIDAERDNFRMDTAFRKHPAFGTMIRRCGDGKYKLAPPSASTAPAAPKGKKSTKMRRNHA